MFKTSYIDVHFCQQVVETVEVLTELSVVFARAAGKLDDVGDDDDYTENNKTE